MTDISLKKLFPQVTDLKGSRVVTPTQNFTVKDGMGATRAQKAY